MACAALLWLICAPGASAETAPSGSIAGRVTDAYGEPLSGICVDVFGEKAVARTAADGTYHVERAPVGTYRIWFDPCDSGPYEPAESTAAEVRDGEVTSNVDGRLETRTSIAGRVIDSSGQPVEGICISGQAGPPGAFAMPFSAKTGPDGSYWVRDRLYPTDVAVRFYDCRSPSSELVANGRVVHLEAGRVTRGVDATMYVGGKLGGRVVDFAGKPLAGVCVNTDTADASGGYWIGQTDASGRFVSGALPNGSYTLLFTTCPMVNGSPFVGKPMFAQWYREQADPSLAERIDISNGQSRLDLSTRLVPSPEACVVPDLTGQRLGRAEKSLDAALCDIGRVRSDRSKTSRGRVIKQRPGRGVVRPEGGSVRLVLGSAPAP